LAAIDPQTRSTILHRIADAITAERTRILAANEEDLAAGKANGVTVDVMKRLALTPQKLDSLAKGIHSIASSDDPIGRVVSRMELTDGLVLSKTTVPIGCILVVFEARPDSLPQICSLCIRTGNSLLLKGGKEAAKSNALLHSIVVKAIHDVTNGHVSSDVITLVSGRTDVSELLKLSDVIDLAIPRGSGSMVASIKNSTRIPVLGHSEGICHVYLDADANYDKALKIAIDAKTDYPAACNSMETLLIHQNLCALPSKPNTDPFAVRILRGLRDVGVKLLAGPRITSLLPNFVFDGSVADFHTEYGEKTLSVEVVPNVQSAVEHIHTYGSSHTDVIVTDNPPVAHLFLRLVDSACVFWNASPRFADGYRFGLGAEVGISTGRIHSRGPVGAEGLLTVKWVLESAASHVVAGDKGITYTHIPIMPTAKL
jgi:delta-1-pyrroline-5-carboxylate synthetase